MSSTAIEPKPIADDPTQTFKIPVSNDGTKYNLHLKVNLDHVRESTAKLFNLNDEIVARIAKDCILWEGPPELNGISHKKIKKMVHEAALNIMLLSTPFPQKPFEVRIPLKLEKNDSHFELVPKEELPSDQVRLFHVKTRADYSQLFAIYNLNTDLFFDSTHLSRQFTVIFPWQNCDTSEMIALLEFLTQENQARVLSVFKDTFPSIQTTAVAIELLVATRLPNCRFLAEPLLRAAAETFSDKSVVWQNELEHLIRIFEYFSPEEQSVFVDKLRNANQPAMAKSLVENLTEAFKILQRINYRIASQRRLNDSQTPFPSLLDILTTSVVRTYVLEQVSKLDKDLHNLDVPSVICYLKCLTTLMEVAIASGLKHLPEKNEFKPLHDSLKRFTEKGLLDRFKSHRDARETDLGINFLAKYALHLLTLMGSDTSQKYRALCCVFYALRGIATIAASVSIDQPWAAVKGVFDSIPDFKKALEVHDRKLKVFIHLNLLQAAYLGGGPNCLLDFNLFANDLLHNPDEAVKHLPIHNRRFFVLGFLELLQMIHQSYEGFPEVGTKAIELINLIKNNNSVAFGHALFKVESKKTSNKVRNFIVKQANEILEKIQLQKAKSRTNIEMGDRLFPLAFKEKFFWSESMRKHLEILNNLLEEDKPYIVPLKGISRGHTKELEDHLRSVLSARNLVFITGEPGSGKTLFIMLYIQHLLTNYKPGDRLPFYYALGSFRGPAGTLMQSILKEYGLEAYEADIKKIPTTIFLDAFDEMVFANNETPPNIYLSNKFEDWDAQFVITCRSNHLRAGQEQHYLAPPGVVPELLSASPFGDPEIDAFFKNYIQVKKAKNEEKRAKGELEEVVWEEGRYREYIGKLGLNRIIQTPYYLRKIADYFPVLDDQLSSVTDGVNDQNDQKQKEFFLDLLVSQSIKREVNKAVVNKAPVHSPSEYLEYALRVNWLMHICGVQAVLKKVPGRETEAERAREREDYTLETSQSSVLIEETLLRQQKETAAQQKKQHEINEIETRLQICSKKLEEIAEGRKKIKVISVAEEELQTLLYGAGSTYLRTEALIKLTTKGMEFAHDILFDYFLEINKDSNRKEQLIKAIDL